MASSPSLSFSSAISGSTLSCSDPKAAQIVSARFLDRPLSSVGVINQRQCSVNPVNAEPKRNNSILPLAATISAPEVAEKIEVEYYDKLAKVLENASPLEIIDKALEKFGNDIAIAFRGAEDVVLARLTGRPYRVFSLDTGRLNPKTYRYFEVVEKQYGSIVFAREVSKCQ